MRLDVDPPGRDEPPRILLWFVLEMWAEGRDLSEPGELSERCERWRAARTRWHEEHGWPTGVLGLLKINRAMRQWAVSVENGQADLNSPPDGGGKP